MAETGFARGSLSPIYYFEDSRGHIVMPVYEAGHPEQARHIFDARFKNQVNYDRGVPRGPYVWKEARSLPEARDLERRLTAQELFKESLMAQTGAFKRKRVKDQIRSNLRHRMTSVDCSQWERDFIKSYMEVDSEQERDRHQETLNQHNYYLWVLQNDAGTKIDDRMPLQPGEFWRQSDEVNNGG